jgi:hypothetical protein
MLGFGTTTFCPQSVQLITCPTLSLCAERWSEQPVQANNTSASDCGVTAGTVNPALHPGQSNASPAMPDGAVSLVGHSGQLNAMPASGTRTF